MRFLLCVYCLYLLLCPIVFCLEPSSELHGQNVYCIVEYVFEARVIKWFNPDKFSQQNTELNSNSTTLNHTNSNAKQELTDNNTTTDSTEEIHIKEYTGGIRIHNGTYQVKLRHIYKNALDLLDFWNDNVVESGQRLIDGEHYIFYANKGNQTNLPEIFHYRKASSFKPEAEKILPLYDCNCQITEFATAELQNQNQSIEISKTDCTASDDVTCLNEMYCRTTFDNATCLYDRGYCSKDEHNGCTWHIIGSCDITNDIESGCLSNLRTNEILFFIYSLLILKIIY